VLYIFVGAESENHPSPHCTGIKECSFITFVYAILPYAMMSAMSHGI
jgi:hypothetical protein